MQLPDLDLVAYAAALRAEAADERLPLIVLTPLGYYERDKCVPGIVEYLAKPIRRAQLYTRLMAVISASSTLTLPQDLRLVQAHEQTTTFSARVLLAEDNPVNQEVACEMLASLGCQIDRAVNGEEAVAMASQSTYALILMDCQMPGMDGLAATRAIRAYEADQQRPRTPVVALTAHSAEEDRQQCLAIGMDDYLSKPFSQEALAHILRRWLTA